MKSAWPWPAGDHSTRQWLVRSTMVFPPSFERRMKWFSPVITGSCGSTSAMVSSLVHFEALAVEAPLVGPAACGEAHFLAAHLAGERERLAVAAHRPGEHLEVLREDRLPAGDVVRALDV